MQEPAVKVPTSGATIESVAPAQPGTIRNDVGYLRGMVGQTTLSMLTVARPRCWASDEDLFSIRIGPSLCPVEVHDTISRAMHGCTVLLTLRYASRRNR